METENPDFLLEQNALENPIEQFRLWFNAAQKGRYPEPNAMALATVSPDGNPHCRMVLLKDFSPDGFIFYTNYRSGKGRDLEQNPRAALMFWWDEHRCQVRIQGWVEKTPAADSEEYFASRPRGSQIAAWASRQSSPVAGREALDRSYAEIEAQFGNEPIPRPPHWGGYCLHPDYFEFWKGRENRMHDRLSYTLGKDGQWKMKRLCP